ncbi:SPFH/Band 7/PHB domain protein [Oligella ureolytica]
MQINQAQGEAEAVITVADATAEAIKKVALAINEPGGMEAVNLQVAENYIESFGKLAKEGNTLIIPSNLADMSSLVASAMTIVKSTNK